MSLRLRRGVAVLAVALLMAAAASPVLASDGPEPRGGWWASVGAWLNQALVSVGLQPVFEQSACGVDPDGKPRPCPGPEAQGESACGVDPDGRPRPCPGV